jgi:hypothetical protein
MKIISFSSILNHFVYYKCIIIHGEGKPCSHYEVNPSSLKHNNVYKRYMTIGSIYHLHIYTETNIGILLELPTKLPISNDRNGCIRYSGLMAFLLWIGSRRLRMKRQVSRSDESE